MLTIKEGKASIQFKRDVSGDVFVNDGATEISIPGELLRKFVVFNQGHSVDGRLMWYWGYSPYQCHEIPYDERRDP